MTLAQECNAIWPLGWEATGREDVAIATADGVTLRCEKDSFIVGGKTYIGGGSLRDRLQHMWQLVRDTPRRMPALVPDVAPVLLLLKELLEPKGWTPSTDFCSWQRKINHMGHWALGVKDNHTKMIFGHSYLGCILSQTPLDANADKAAVAAALEKLFADLPRFP